MSKSILDELDVETPDYNTVQELMRSRSETLEQLETFVYSPDWADARKNVDMGQLKNNYSQLADLDKKIRDTLKIYAEKSDRELDSVGKELKAQNSYTKTSTKSGSFFIENKLHG